MKMTTFALSSVSICTLYSYKAIRVCSLGKPLAIRIPRSYSQILQVRLAALQLRRKAYNLIKAMLRASPALSDITVYETAILSWGKPISQKKKDKQIRSST